jgi:hypothetical protein
MPELAILGDYLSSADFLSAQPGFREGWRAAPLLTRQAASIEGQRFFESVTAHNFATGLNEIIEGTEYNLSYSAAQIALSASRAVLHRRWSSAGIKDRLTGRRGMAENMAKLLGGLVTEEEPITE